MASTQLLSAKRKNRCGLKDRREWRVIPLKLKRERESGRIKSRSKEKTFGGSERRFISGEKKENLVRRYPGNVRSTF
jgi:hypothetical protein